MILADLAAELGGWSGPVLVLLGIGAIAGTKYTVDQSKRDAKSARTLDYMRRLFDLDFAPLNAQVLTFMRTGDPISLSAYAKTPHLPTGQPESISDAEVAYGGLENRLKAQVALVLNFYEELCGSYRAELLDRTIAGKMLEPVILNAWGAVTWFVAFMRREVEAKYASEGKLTGAEIKEVASEVLREWELVVNELGELDKNPKPTSRSLWSWLRDPRWLQRSFLIPLTAFVALAILVIAASAADGPHDVASTFLFSAAAVCLLAAAIGIALLLADPPHRRAALVTAAVAWTLTVGLTATLDLKFSIAPPGPEGHRGVHGLRGKQGREGKAGRDGTVGPEGPAGPQGEQGLRGHRGPTGHRGHEGPPGPRGPRGYSDTP